MNWKSRLFWLAGMVGLFLIAWIGFSSFETPVDFNKEVRPILNRNCLGCHGGVKQAGGLSFLFEHEVFGVTESGKPAIVKGNAAKSEIIKRILHEDPEMRMPPKGASLSKAEVDLLKRWINQGAKWQTHWAYIVPEKTLPPTSPPTVSFPIQNEIDQFILAKLQEKGLTPSEKADKITLIRRVSLDLIGLPPTPTEVRDFLADTSTNAFEKVVERLLASPHFGERWATMWMDLARYGDSQGYQKDRYRSMWQYRDWVIEAFNQNLPFDAFTIQQLAGDLLPNPTEEQIIATAFHRNTMNNDEGGTDDEEFRVAAVIDRVNTTWEVWQGTTMACVQCHSHPYDPFVHKDFYTAFAFFNQTADVDRTDEYPNYLTFSKTAKSSIREYAKKAGVAVAHPDLDSKALKAIQKTLLFPNWKPGLCDGSANVRFKEQQMQFVGKQAGFKFEDVKLDKVTGITLEHTLFKGQGNLIVAFDSLGQAVLAASTVKGTKTSLTFAPQQGIKSLYFIFTAEAGFPKDFWLEWVKFKGVETTLPETVQAELSNVKMVETPIMQELPKDTARITSVFVKGNWLVRADTVYPYMPESLTKLPKHNNYNRLDLAQWLVSDENPLTARVIINRFWAEFFGKGIVETLEDFGTQGFEPTHPALLDWLALEFQKNQAWNVKNMLRLIVLSSTYQQSSIASIEHIEKDPNNRYLARFPRIRLTSEQVRDQSLALSGLLSTKMYGPSVMPPQPDGIWEVIRNVMEWKESSGEDRYRRGLYTFIRKSSPYPMAISFDSPSREFCVSRRIRTNTPLQALNIMNDTVFVEAARALAQQMQALETLNAQLVFGYQRVSFKKPDANVLNILKTNYLTNFNYYQLHLQEAKQLTLSETVGLPHAAALVVIANILLNLDEIMVKE
jgi:hypothetical protein